MMEVVTCGDITGAITKTCKAPVKSSPIFYRPDALPVAQPTVPKFWGEIISDTIHSLIE